MDRTVAARPKAYAVTQVIAIDPVEIGSPHEADHLVVVIGSYPSRQEAEAALRDLTRSCPEFECAAAQAGEPNRITFLEEFIANPRYLASRRYFVGSPPIDDIRNSRAAVRRRALAAARRDELVAGHR